MSKRSEKKDKYYMVFYIGFSGTWGIPEPISRYLYHGRHKRIKKRKKYAIKFKKRRKK